MLPGVTVVKQDGGLGTLPATADGKRGIVGVCTSGTPNQIYILVDQGAVPGVLGRGPLADAVITQLRKAGGVVYAVPAAATVNGSITPAVGNPSSPEVTLGTTSTEALQVQVKVTKSGALGAGQFQYTLDGGDTWSRSYTLAASFAIPGRGLTITFAAGSYTVGATYKFTVTAPTASIGDLQAAAQVLVDSPYLMEFIHFAQPGDNSLWAVAAAVVEDAFNKHKYTHSLCEAPGPGSNVDTWVTTLAGYRSSFTSKDVSVVAPWAEVVDPSGLQIERNSANWYMGRLCSINIADNPAHVGKGSITGLSVVSPFTTGTYGKASSYNNGHALALDELGYVALMKHQGRNGLFFVEGRTMADPSSDYSTIMNVRVMNKVMTLQHQIWLDQVQGKVNPLNIEESLAYMLATSNAAFELMAAREELVKATIIIPPGQDILSTRQIIVEFRVVPFAYSKEIVLKVGYENPLLTGQSA
ncbi:DUF2586 family protein [Deinococcus cellulosilyticus]|uniref:Tail sheath protein n=1 Tax=Deinococcus cellulosilyticus (strain DSM 18568 / NBRC 106333 / KACC 11606 / 5516J-15) TaxID=1223518 RepID=A0A511MW74_DEIC1|nr:DUF2586 family protein [Deinococcus cellulosilyticus]GEM44829.1 hypothetical protein DC3_04640 [Deinococcus cellulosilyticus NBRC 106333 = KACC 11606]